MDKRVQRFKGSEVQRFRGSGLIGSKVSGSELMHPGPRTPEP